jgi:hypothetical protein
VAAFTEDVPTVLRLIKQLAVYEREPESVVKTTEADLIRDGFSDEAPFFRVLLAELPSTGSDAPVVAGFALYFFQYSTWEVRLCFFMLHVCVGVSSAACTLLIGDVASPSLFSAYG